MALTKLCPKCGKRIPIDKKYCGACMDKVNSRHKEYNRVIRHSKDNIKYEKFYQSIEWKRLRELVVLRDKGLCQDCLKNNKITFYDAVHHIVPIKTNYSKRLNIDNLICLCESCHQYRHIELKEVGGTKKV